MLRIWDQTHRTLSLTFHVFRLQEQRDQGSEGRFRRVRGSRHGQRRRRQGRGTQEAAAAGQSIDRRLSQVSPEACTVKPEVNLIKQF